MNKEEYLSFSSKLGRHSFYAPEYLIREHLVKECRHLAHAWHISMTYNETLEAYYFTHSWNRRKTCRSYMSDF